jgi:1-acyl-sn-glycerol-3-phosphate acyltransferase
MVELGELADRLQAYQRTRAAAMNGARAAGLPAGRFARRLAGRARKAIDQGALEPETLKGAWYMARYTADYQRDMLRRRLKGEVETDEWGLDAELVETFRPFFDFLAKVYWRVETLGLAHVPNYGRALLVSNHSIQAAWDGILLTAVLLGEHPAQRLPRILFADWTLRLPFLASLAAKLGQTRASVENGIRLLEADEVVVLFPEGAAALAEPPGRLARFGRSDLAVMALATGAPIIPVAITSSPPAVDQAALPRSVRKALRSPLATAARQVAMAPLVLTPVPLKWTVEFGPPLATAEHDPEAARDPVLVSRLTDKVRDVVQQMVGARAAATQLK